MSIFRPMIQGSRDVIAPIDISLRCPNCRIKGVFYGWSQALDWGWSQYKNPDADNSGTRAQEQERVHAGVRQCPHQPCSTVVFVLHQRGKLIASYPAEVLDFDPSSIPEKVCAALTEAIKCHSQECYSASALMVRKTLEELCQDRGAQGANLGERINALSSSVILPTGFIEAAHEIRFLGNDAAHIEAREYSNVGKEEVEIAIELAKEFLKAVYQLSSLVERMQNLKNRVQSEP